MKTELTPALRRFLRQVCRRLNLPRRWKDRVRSDLTGSIAAQLEAGIPEEAILQNLGTPTKVAAEFNEQMKEFTFRKSPLRFLFLAVAILSGLALMVELFLNYFLGEIFSFGARSVGVIGGADGPTSIIVATSTVNWFELLVPYALFILVGIAGYLWFRHRKNKE